MVCSVNKPSKRNWKNVRVDYNDIISSMPSLKEISLKNFISKGMSCDQIFPQIAKMNSYYLSQDLEEINANSIACKILQLKARLSSDGTDSEEDKESLNEEEEDVESASEQEVDEDGASEQEVDEDGASEQKGKKGKKQGIYNSSGEIDFDADTFGDIAVESDGSDVTDPEVEDQFDEPHELDEQTKNILYDDFFEEDGINEGCDAKFADFFEDVPKDNKQNENQGIPLQKSTFEVCEEKNQRKMRQLEKQNIGQQDWFLTGEVTKKSRPEYSVLEEDLDFKTTANPKPIVTEELNQKIEKIVLDRIKRKAFDNVERKIKHMVDPFDYREKFQVDEEKSKKSLADIYVEDFLKKRQATNKETPAFLLTGYVAPKEESDVKRELRYKVANLFKILDALCNKHHTPYLTMEDQKMESKASALSVEEATPIAISDGMMLAPEEIAAPSKMDMKGKTERTVTDRKRERRRKKIYQRQQGIKEDDNLKKQLKTPSSKAGHQQASIQFVEKAVKRGYVKVLKSNPAIKTSTSFFAAMDEGQPERKKRRVD